MKNNLFHLFFAFISVTIVYGYGFPLEAFGQQEAAARRVNVYSEGTLDRQELIAKTLAFVKSVEEQGANARGRVIVQTRVVKFTGRCKDDKPIYDKGVEMIVRDVLGNLPKEISERIVIQSVDLTILFNASFWLIPEGAKEPAIVESGYHPWCPECPAVRVIGKPKVPKGTRIIEFEVTTSQLCDEEKLEWAVSSGRIIEGQGTKKIKVDISGLSIGSVTATFNIEMWRLECYVCPSEHSLTTEIDGSN